MKKMLAFSSICYCQSGNAVESAAQTATNSSTTVIISEHYLTQETTEKN